MLWTAGPAALGGRFACPIHEYLGLLCPGCGGTHAVVALLHGRLLQAWQDNALLVTLLPVAVVYAGFVLWGMWRRDADPFPPVSRSAVYLLLAVAAVFTVARNLAQ